MNYAARTQQSKVADHATKSANFDSGYMDGAATGYRTGYGDGHADGSAGKPNKFEERANKK